MKTFSVYDLQRIFNCSRQSAYTLVTSGRIRSVKIGRLYRVSEAALAEFLNGGGSSGGQREMPREAA